MKIGNGQAVISDKQASSEDAHILAIGVYAERVVFLERTIRSLRIEKDRLEDENSKIRLELRELKKDSNGDEL